MSWDAAVAAPLLMLNGALLAPPAKTVSSNVRVNTGVRAIAQRHTVAVDAGGRPTWSAVEVREGIC
jgi:hypothetical protein